MPPEFLLPFGPFHIVVQHLPIGLIVGVWILECFAPKPEKQRSAPLAWMHSALLLATGVTIALGIAYQSQGGYGTEIDAHRQWGLLFGAALLATYILFWIDAAARHALSRIFYILSLTLTTAALVASAHLGGELIHGKGFLLKPFKKEDPVPVSKTVKAQEVPTAPKASTKVTSVETGAQSVPGRTLSQTLAPASTVLTAQQSEEIDTRVALFHAAHTVFERNCLSCHGSTKKKGGYRLDTQKSLFTAGKSKIAPVLAGNPADSHIIMRMILPRENDEAMPPIEKDPVPASDLEAVRQWILAGAYWPTDAEMRMAAESFKDYGNAETDALLKAISAFGVKAEYNAWGDDSVRIDLAVVHPGKLESALGALSNFRTELTWLDSSNLELPEPFLNDLSRFAKLQRLHLDGTNINDAQLKQIGSLKELQYLNLFNTGITDQSVPTLRALPSLRKVYLGSTAITQSAVDSLRQARPNLEIVHQSPRPFISSGRPNPQGPRR
ncbi:MAG: c-type cytochrome domain-containing protein [Coraliomargaritaceae bacterium]